MDKMHVGFYSQLFKAHIVTLLVAEHKQIRRWMGKIVMRYCMKLNISKSVCLVTSVCQYYNFTIVACTRCYNGAVVVLTDVTKHTFKLCSNTDGLLISSV